MRRQLGILKLFGILVLMATSCLSAGSPAVLPFFSTPPSLTEYARLRPDVNNNYLYALEETTVANKPRVVFLYHNHTASDAGRWLLPDGAAPPNAAAARVTTIAAELLAQARVREFAGADHDIHAQQPAELVAELLALAQER